MLKINKFVNELETIFNSLVENNIINDYYIIVNVEGFVEVKILVKNHIPNFCEKYNLLKYDNGLAIREILISDYDNHEKFLDNDKKVFYHKRYSYTPKNFKEQKDINIISFYAVESEYGSAILPYTIAVNLIKEGKKVVLVDLDVYNPKYNADSKGFLEYMVDKQFCYLHENEKLSIKDYGKLYQEGLFIIPAVDITDNFTYIQSLETFSFGEDFGDFVEDIKNEFFCGSDDIENNFIIFNLPNGINNIMNHVFEYSTKVIGVFDSKSENLNKNSIQYLIKYIPKEKLIFGNTYYKHGFEIEELKNQIKLYSEHEYTVVYTKDVISYLRIY